MKVHKTDLDQTRVSLPLSPPLVIEEGGGGWGALVHKYVCHMQMNSHI